MPRAGGAAGITLPMTTADTFIEGNLIGEVPHLRR
jgi:hypothetical protein